MSKAANPKLFLGMAAGSLLLGGALVYMQFGNISRQQEKVDAIREEVSKAESLGRDLNASNERLGALKVKLAHLERGVQDYQYVPTLLKELEQVGNANGLQVLGVRPVVAPPASKPDEKVMRKPYDELTIEVKGRGTYGAVLKFLEGLQRFPKVVAARTLTLNPKTDGTERAGVSPKLDTSIELKVFIFPEAKSEPRIGDESVAATEVSNNG